MMKKILFSLLVLAPCITKAMEKACPAQDSVVNIIKQRNNTEKLKAVEQLLANGANVDEVDESGGNGFSVTL
jgi:hypothetical protein